jgi:hypothetical protein
VEKTVWKAERAWFLERSERRAKPGIEPLLTRWGKSGVFSQSTVLSVLKHTRRPISSASLGGQDRCGETMLGESKGVCPLGRRTQVREGEAASREVASERWKGEGGALSPPRRFGKAKSSRSLLPFPCILPTQSGRESFNIIGLCQRTWIQNWGHALLAARLIGIIPKIREAPEASNQIYFL